MPSDVAYGSSVRMGGPYGPITFSTERGYFDRAGLASPTSRPRTVWTFAYAGATVAIIARDGSTLGSAGLSKQWACRPGGRTSPESACSPGWAASASGSRCSRAAPDRTTSAGGRTSLALQWG